MSRPTRSQTNTSSNPSFLSPTAYDDDASSLHSNSSLHSDQETDSSDDEVLLGARTSADIRAHDRSVLIEEEERDKLLEESRKRGRRGSALSLTKGIGGGLGNIRKMFGKSYDKLPGVPSTGALSEVEADEDSKLMGNKKATRRKGRKERRSKKKAQLMADAQHGEDGELMYEMEEGHMKEGSSTGSSSDSELSSEQDRRGLRSMSNEKSSRKRKWRRWCFIHLLIVVGFSILVLVAWKLSLNRKGVKLNQVIRSNGTALFAPTTILISLDGFRADFLKRGITPRLNAFIEEGVSPVYMNPSFPSVTFPNHYTLVTGLYPESHGIVGNTFWDKELQEEFFYTNPNAMTSKWWGGEPLWVTAEKQGIRTAIHMWPGSEANIMDVEPAFLDKYNGKEALSRKVDRVLELLDKPGQEDEVAEVVNMRPQLIAAYVPNVDQDGHLYGPNSTEIRTTINNVDRMLDDLFHGLDQRNLTDIVNVVVVSDHGMATTDVNRLIQLEDIIDTSLIEHMDGWPLYGLRPKDPAHLQSLYDTLATEAAKNPNYEVYLRDVNMPERYHFSKNERIAPLWIVPKTGWAIVTKEEFNVAEGIKQGLQYHPRGLHGYDHEHPLMRAIFVARGPAFPHKPNSRVEPFQNIEVYNIICDSLDLTPKPNNGTLRLPLKTIGLHSPETSPEEPSDPPPPNTVSAPRPPPSSIPTPPAPSAPPVATPVPFIPALPPAIASFLSVATYQPPTPTPSEAAPEAIISISPIENPQANPDPQNQNPKPVGVDLIEETNVTRPVVGDGAGNNIVVGEGKTDAQKDKDFWDWFQGKLDEVKEWFGGVVGSKNSTEKAS